jgi:hypothetical protein
MKRAGLTVVVLLAALASGCSNTQDVDDSEQDLVFARSQLGTAPTVRQASVWAVVGLRRELSIEYANQQEIYLRFEVGPLSLLRKPNGDVFLPGDSVLITVTLDESDRMVAHFEPSGLIFSPLAPARLEFSHRFAQPDLDQDGDVDSADEALRARLAIYKQETLSLPWLPLTTVNLSVFRLLADVQSFTGFAMATN